MNALLDPRASDRLIKILGLLGSDHDGEVAAAGRKAHALIRGLGLSWSDIITTSPSISPEPDVRETPWRRMATFCYSRRARLFAHEIKFVEQMLRWHGSPSDKQQAWLSGLYA